MDVIKSKTKDAPSTQRPETNIDVRFPTKPTVFISYFITQFFSFFAFYFSDSQMRLDDDSQETSDKYSF